MKNKLLLAALLAATACMPQQKIVTEKWLVSQKRFVPSRLPAAGANPVCRSELYTLEEVKREAQHYENQLSQGKKIKGKWKHLDLEKLSIPQAKFLQAIGNNFGDLNNPAAFDISSCQDVPCVVNKVYQSEDGLEGWTVYLWYLKMGNVLAFKNKIHRQNNSAAGTYNGKVYPLADYLFSRDELYGFWRMSHALTTPYKLLPDLKEIQRIPRKAFFEDSGPMTCGLAWSDGYVLLNDGCLAFGYSSKDTGFIYEGTTHELAHQIDYYWGNNLPKGYYSQNGKWKEMAGWFEQVYVDTDGKQKTRWVTTLKDEQFVRSYAKNSPAEHFADTSAYYRYQGDLTKRKIPNDIFEHLREKVFEKQEYDEIGLFAQFEKDTTQLLAPSVFKAAVDCENEPTSSPGVSPLAADLFPFTVSINTRRCLKERLQQLSDQAVVEAKLNHVNGCDYLKSNDKTVKFRTQMESVLSGQIVEHLKAARANQEYYKKLNEFYKQLAERAAPLRLMTGCYGELDERACYDAAIVEYVDQLIPQDLQNAENMKEDLRQMFLNANRFEAVKVETMKVHQDFIFTQSALLTESAQALWKECKDLAWSDESAPIVGPFSVGDGWMVSSQFNCLSMDIPTRTREVISEMSFEALGVSDGKEAKLLFDLSLPVYVGEIKRIYEVEKAEEGRGVENLKRSQGTVIKQKLEQDFSWVSGLGAQVRRDCEQAAWQSLPADLRYHQAKSAFASVVDSACQSVMSSDKFTTWLNSQQGMVEEHVLNTYLERLEVQGMAKADQCVKNFPMRNVLERLKNKKPRERCLDDSWVSLSLVAWQESLAIVGSTLKVDRATIMQRADLPSKRLQGKVKREKFVD